MMVLNIKQQQIAAILIECAKKHKTISFSELGLRVGMGRRQVGRPAGAVSRRCSELGLPFLSVILVYKNTKEYGYGYFEEFYANVKDEKTRQTIFEEDKQKVFECKDWSALENELECDIDPIAVQEHAVIEGDRITYEVNGRKRDEGLRNDCIIQNGTKCAICGFDAAEVYGDEFAGKIHVHHKNPLAAREGANETTVQDLIPVCPNCHMILHSKKGKNEVYDYKEVKKMLRMHYKQD